VDTLWNIGVSCKQKCVSAVIAHKNILLQIALVSLFGFTLLVFSWKIALFLTLYVAVHECGHAWALRKVNMPVAGIYFIPFLGAITQIGEHNKTLLTRKKEVFFILMGPAWGFAFCAGLLAVWAIILFWQETNIRFLIQSVFLLTALNLFNLLPVSFLDGSKVFRACVFSIQSWIGFFLIGTAIIIYAILWSLTGAWLFVLFFAICLGNFIDLIRAKQRMQNSRLLYAALRLAFREITHQTAKQRISEEITHLEETTLPITNLMEQRHALVALISYAALAALHYPIMIFAMPFLPNTLYWNLMSRYIL
jgi:Zn-dependent protease